LVRWPDSSERNVDMGMFRVEVANGDPFDGNPDILLQLPHQITRQACEVNAVAEFRRDYDLPKTLVPRSLP
jgi:hypothetical protein